VRWGNPGGRSSQASRPVGSAKRGGGGDVGGRVGEIGTGECQNRVKSRSRAARGPWEKRDNPEGKGNEGSRREKKSCSSRWEGSTAVV